VCCTLLPAVGTVDTKRELRHRALRTALRLVYFFSTVNEAGPDEVAAATTIIKIVKTRQWFLRDDDGTAKTSNRHHEEESIQTNRQARPLWTAPQRFGAAATTSLVLFLLCESQSRDDPFTPTDDLLGGMDALLASSLLASATRELVCVCTKQKVSSTCRNYSTRSNTEKCSTGVMHCTLEMNK